MVVVKWEVNEELKLLWKCKKIKSGGGGSQVRPGWGVEGGGGGLVDREGVCW